jgi:senataxin
MVQERPTRTIGIFNSAIKQTVRRPVEVEGANNGTTPPFGPVLHVLSVAQDMLSALCDPATGLLRKKSLSSPELQAVFSWWSVQWNWIENVFKSTEAWSRYMELTIMTDLCREMIELAESLVKETALLASAFKEDALRNGTSSKDESELQSAMMRKVLDPCGRYLYGLIRMLRLRDEYLVTITTRIVCQLLERLREVDVEIGTDSRTYIHRTCKINSAGKYEVATNLTRQQKAELLMALDGDEDEVEIVGERAVVPIHERKTIGITATPQLKKQSKSDAWTKSGIGQRTNRDDVLELSSNYENRKSTLALIGLRQEKTRSPATKPTKPALSRPPAVLDAERIKALKDSRLQAQLDKKKRDAEAIAKAKAIRSGGLGLDQPPQRSEIMVESSEDEDDESDGDEGLAEFIKNQRAQTKTQDDHERRQAVSLLKTHQGPIKKRKQNLNEKDMRARIDPNMGPLHHAILEWDIFHEGNDPPNGIGATKVSNTYRDEFEYRSTFHPLLLHEAWRSFVTAKDECTSKPFGLKVATRMTFDGFLQVTSLMPAQEKKERQERPVSEGDIVIVSKASDPLKQKDAPHCLARIHKVQFKKGSLEIEYRVSPKSRTIIPELIPGNTLHFVKITNMTTIEREYATLQGLQHYDLLQEVLVAKPSPILKYGEEAVQKCMGNYGLNPGQAKAVLGARDNDGFTLIQG